MTLNDYLSLFPGASREKSRFMALAEAVLQQVVDLQAVMPGIMSAFTPDGASGAQLDTVGESMGLSRLDTASGITATDEEYRDYIKKKLMRIGLAICAVLLLDPYEQVPVLASPPDPASMKPQRKIDIWKVSEKSEKS